MIYQISEMLKSILTKRTVPLIMFWVTLTSSSIQADADEDNEKINFLSLQHALFITCIVEVLGAIFFFFTALYVVEDKEKAETETPGWPTYTPIVN